MDFDKRYNLLTLNSYFVRLSAYEAVSTDTRQGVKKPDDVNSIELIVSLYFYCTIFCHFIIPYLTSFNTTFYNIMGIAIL